MYFRKKRFSMYFNGLLFWFRIRNKEENPKGFFARIGKE